MVSLHSFGHKSICKDFGGVEDALKWYSENHQDIPKEQVYIRVGVERWHYIWMEETVVMLPCDKKDCKELEMEI